MERQLPIWATTIAVYKIIAGHLPYAVRIVWVWYVILLLLFMTIFFLAGDETAALLTSLLSLVAWSAIAVLWHRRLLRDEEISSAQIWLDRRTWRYLLRGIAICLVTFVPLFLVVFVVTFTVSLMLVDAAEVIALMVAAPAGIAVIIIVLRLSIALPAVALDVSQIGLGDAWRATHGNGIRLFVISTIAAIPFIAADWLFSLTTEPMSYLGFSIGLVLLEPLRLAIELGYLLIGATILSLSYAFLIENRATGTTMPTS